jgi:hypothetical protein
MSHSEVYVRRLGDVAFTVTAAMVALSVVYDFGFRHGRAVGRIAGTVDAMCKFDRTMEQLRQEGKRRGW